MIADYAALISAICAVGTLVMVFINAYNIHRLEHNTNNIKDELIKEVSKTSRAKGIKEGRRRRK